MSVYAMLVFVHVAAASTLFVSLGAESVALAALRRARAAADARLWAGILALPGRLGPLAMLLTVASGGWMMKVAWGPRPWLVHAVGALIAMAATGAALTVPRLLRVRAALQAGAWTPSREAGLAISLRLRLALGGGILGLMTFKPETAGATAIVALSVAAGLVSAIPLRISAPAT